MKRWLSALLLTLIVAAAANCQTFRGAINGTVTDPSGAAVPNATVKAIESATSIEHTTVTTSEGQFAFQDMPLGFYKVTVTAAGFPTNTVDKVEVLAGTIYTLSVQLKLGQSSTTVEVSAAALTLDTTSATQNTTISSDVVQDVPLNGRDFTQLIAVSPGYAGYSVGGFGSLNGTRPNQMNWQIDGVDNNDFWHNIPAVNQGGVSGIAGTVLPIDSVEEFSAQSQAGPESGRNAGGTVNVIIKSGGNTLHGSVYYYNRNEFYGAGSPFLAPGTKTPRLRNENYGFSLLGPIIKNKTFYFVSYEKQDFIIGLSGKATEPSNAWVGQAADLLANPGNKYGTYSAVSPSTLSCAGASASGCTGGLLGPGGLWPLNIISGLPVGAGNFLSPTAEFGYSYNGVVKVDHQFNDKHHLYLRWIAGQGNQTAPTGGSPALGTASSNLAYYFEVAPLHVGNYSAVLNSTFSSKLTNQVLFGANYFNQLFHDFNNSFVTQNIGLFLSPDALDHGQPIIGAPNVRIKGFEQTGITDPKGRSDLTWHVNDIVSYSTGAHQLRFGAEVRQAHLNAFYHRHSTGTFRFDGTQGPWDGPNGCGVITAANQAACNTVSSTAFALADFIAGDVSSSSVAVGDPERFVTVNAYNLYFQDAWQATKKLSLTFGLRYEYFGPMHSDRKDISVFIPGVGFKTQGAGIDSLWPPDRNNIAPRFGFAYQPGSKGDLVVRGSVGVFYDQINLNPFLDFRPPITASQGIQGNAFGSHGVSTFRADFCGDTSYNWQAVQVPNSICPASSPNAGAVNVAGSIFPKLATCADPNCLGLNDPQGLSAYSISQNFRTPYFYNYSLQLEKSLGKSAEFQVGYVGSQGRKLNIISNINQNGDFPQFGNILQMNSSGTSNYNSLQTTFKLRNWHGLTSQFGYTWSHSMDIISEYRATILDDAFNPKRDYGNSDFDTRHAFSASFVYEIPRAKWASNGWKNRVVNGWEVSSLWNFHTGQPFDEVLSYLNLIGDPYKGLDHKFSQANGGTLWVNPEAFCDPSVGDSACPGSGFGNISRNKLYGPGYGAVDLSVFKNVAITERVKLQLRAEMFNLLNRINLASGVGSVAVGGNNSPNYNTCNQGPLTNHHCSTLPDDGFGMITDTIGDFNGAPGLGPGEQFNMQLAIKLIF
jgi:hypothetical protein